MVPAAAVLTAVALMAAAVPTPVAVGTVPMVAGDFTVVVLTAVGAPTAVAADLAPGVVADSTPAAVLTAVAADILSAAILEVGYLLDPRRGAVARMEHLPL